MNSNRPWPESGHKYSTVHTRNWSRFRLRHLVRRYIRPALFRLSSHISLKTNFGKWRCRYDPVHLVGLFRWPGCFKIAELCCAPDRWYIARTAGGSPVSRIGSGSVDWGQDSGSVVNVAAPMSNLFQRRLPMAIDQREGVQMLITTRPYSWRRWPKREKTGWISDWELGVHRKRYLIRQSTFRSSSLGVHHVIVGKPLDLCPRQSISTIAINFFKVYFWVVFDKRPTCCPIANIQKRFTLFSSNAGA